MTAVIIGPGRIGCGFVGHALESSGFPLLFIGRNPDKLSRLNDSGRYRVRLSDGGNISESIVRGVEAISVHERSVAVERIARAELVATAVGASNLADVALLIAEGLSRRRSPVNVLAFENADDAGRRLRELVAQRLGHRRASIHGFAGALVFRAVSRLEVDPDPAVPLTLIGDPTSAFVVDGTGLRDPWPAISGMSVVDNYPAQLRRKLFTFGVGHSVCAYLGRLKGYHYIHAAIRDPEIRGGVLDAMNEGQTGLAARHGADFAGDRHALTRILHRFDNAVLDDPIVRVAREPRRKLGPRERLAGAARLAVRAGIVPENLATGVAAALTYRHTADPDSIELHREIGTGGFRSVLERISGIDGDSPLGRRIVETCQRFTHGSQQVIHMISLTDGLWAWEPSAHPRAVPTIQRRYAAFGRMSRLARPDDPALVSGRIAGTGHRA